MLNKLQISDKSAKFIIFVGSKLVMPDLKKTLRQIRNRTTSELSGFVDEEMDRIDRLYQWLDEKKRTCEDSTKSFSENKARSSKKNQSPPTH
jgi:hypothetical protein